MSGVAIWKPVSYPRTSRTVQGPSQISLGTDGTGAASQRWIRVNVQQAVWEEENSMMFDDRYLHKVRNHTDGVRVVLCMDILRPLRFPGSRLNDAIIGLVRRSGYMQEAKKNQQRWKERLVD